MAGHNELSLGRPKPQGTMTPCLILQFPFSGGQFHFISIQNPDDRTARRLARSHAVAQGIENKRKLQQKMGLNFHAVSLKGDLGQPARKRKRDQALVAPLCSVSAPSPFQMLAAESPRLQALFSRRKIFASALDYPVKA